jgi:hypothetical protein
MDNQQETVLEWIPQRLHVMPPDIYLGDDIVLPILKDIRF